MAYTGIRVDTKIGVFLTTTEPHGFARWTGRAAFMEDALDRKTATDFWRRSQTRSCVYVQRSDRRNCEVAGLSDFSGTRNIGNPGGDDDQTVR